MRDVVTDLSDLSEVDLRALTVVEAWPVDALPVARDNIRLSSPFGGDSSVREGDLDAGAAEVDHRDQRVGGVETVSAV